jgi:hypothetical protein
MKPLDVYGYVDPGTTLLPGQRPGLLVEDVLRSGQDVVGKAVAFRGPIGSPFVAAAIVVEPIRLVSTP